MFDNSDPYIQQKTELYGHRVSDILSFLDQPTKENYTNFLKTKKMSDSSGGVLYSKNPNDSSEKLEVTSEQYQQQQSDLVSAQYINELRKAGRPVNEKELAIEKQIKDNLGVDSIDKLEDLKLASVSKVLNPGFTLNQDLKEQFVLAATSNTYYLTQLEKAIDGLYEIWGNRLEFNQNFFNSRTGVASRKPFYGTYESQAGLTTNIARGMANTSSSLISTNSVQSQLEASAKILYQLVTIGAIAPNGELNIRPINIKTGNFEVTQEEIE